ncbi:zf-HC2 domain-containing protein [Streptomyces sp. NPDC005803]|uniref:zf-HC2 domain-containing protein n=1 Tax=Streptomyces sp. NPDC005803 TaxID=3154297 RepID=UPI0034109DFB
MSDSWTVSVRDGMCTPPPHRDVGAYALGVLDAADAFRFEEHLEDCLPCADRAVELGRVAAVLARYARLTQGVDPVARAGAGPAMEAVAAGRRRTWRRRLGLVAAAAALSAAARATARSPGPTSGRPT